MSVETFSGIAFLIGTLVFAVLIFGATSGPKNNDHEGDSK